MPHNLTLTDAELTVISDCLMLGPFGRVAPVVQSINKQIQKNLDVETAQRTFSDKPTDNDLSLNK